MNDSSKEFWNTYYKIRYVGAITEEKTDEEYKFLKALLPIDKYPTVFDFICGFGRFSTRFAKDGYIVDGIDIDEDSIRQGNATGTKNMNLQLADATTFVSQKQYSAGICMYSSISVLGIEKNKAAAHTLYNSIKPGGLIILDLLNPDWAKSHTKQSKKTIIYQGVSYEVEHKSEICEAPLREENSITFNNGSEVKTLDHINYLYYPESVPELFGPGRVSIEATYGGFDYVPISAERQRMLLVLKVT